MIGTNSYAKLGIFCALLVAFFVTGYLEESSRADRKRPDWKKISPFTAVSFKDESILAEYEGIVYEVSSIEGIESRELVKAAKKRFRQEWQKRIREDIAEVLLAAGAPDSIYVDLELKNLETGRVKSVSDAEMTRANRSKINKAL